MQAKNIKISTRMTSSVHILGVLLTVALLLAVSWLSGRNVRDARSFMTGGTSGTWMVGGALLGTMAGGQSTIGTAQLAFCYGLSAWWFTLGAAIGCLLLGYAYAGPLRRSGCTTLLEIVRSEYGRRAETVGSVLCMVGIFISIVSQVLSSGAMISSFFSIPMLWASISGAVLILLLVFFGGIRSAGVSGLVKLILLYFSSLAAGAIVWHIGGGIDGLRSGVETIYQSDTLSRIGSLPDIESIHHRYGSLVARGVMKDLGGCLSLVLGVVSTQTYAQCIWSASTTRHARRGALICAFCLPLIGAACTTGGHLHARTLCHRRRMGSHAAGRRDTARRNRHNRKLGSGFPSLHTGTSALVAGRHHARNTAHQHSGLWQRTVARSSNDTRARRLRKPDAQGFAVVATGRDTALDSHHTRCGCRLCHDVEQFLHQRSWLPVARIACRVDTFPTQPCTVDAQTLCCKPHTDSHAGRSSSHAGSQDTVNARRCSLLWTRRRTVVHTHPYRKESRQTMTAPTYKEEKTARQPLK